MRPEPDLAVAPAAPSARPWLRLNVEMMAWGTVVVIAALARLPSLGALPLRLSDSTSALTAWQVAGGRLPAVWSGDLTQSLTAGLFKVFGASDALSRLVPALFGVGLVAAMSLTRPVAGRVPALLAALFLALSPICVVVSRSISPYSAGAVFAAGAAAVLLSFIDRPRPAPLAWLAALLGLGLSTDATFLVFLLAAALFCLVEGLWLEDEAVAAAWHYLRNHGSLFRALLLIWAAGLLLSVTRFGIATDRLRSGAMLSWADTFRPVGGTVPWHFPIDVLLAYEPLLLVAGGLELGLIAMRMRDRGTCRWERLVLYWCMAAMIFALIVPRREMGQLSIVLVPLALAAGGAFSRWLATAGKGGLRPSVAPALLALPAFIYVLFVLESSTVQAGLASTQVAAVVSLLVGGLILLALGAVWAQQAGPAFLAACGLIFGLGFALHSLSRVGFQIGDEFLLGPVATNQAPALSQEVIRTATSLNGAVSVAPALAEPLAWYMRGGATVGFQTPSRASAAVVQPVEFADVPGFEPLIANNEVGRSWYPAGIDVNGVLRWLLYRQAWGPVRTTSAEFLIKQ